MPDEGEGAEEGPLSSAEFEGQSDIRQVRGEGEGICKVTASPKDSLQSISCDVVSSPHAQPQFSFAKAAFIVQGPLVLWSGATGCEGQ